MRKHKRAFTLTELQIAFAIMLITLAATMALYLFYLRSFSMGNAILDVYANSRVAMGRMERDIRAAAQVVLSHSPYTTSDHVIVLQVPSIDATGNVISSHYDYITYELQGSDLYRIIQRDALSSRQNENRAVAHYCASLTFSSGGLALSQVPNLSAINTVAVYLPLNKAAISLSGSGTVIESITPTTVIRMRNK